MKNAYVKVGNLLSRNTGRAIANQFIIVTDDGYYMQSYDSVVVHYNRRDNVLTLGYDWNYSKTTLKYVEQFIDEYTTYGKMTKAEIQQAINENVFLYDEDMF